MESFTIRSLTFSYPGQSRKTLDNLNLSIHQGEFVTLIGRSGCGKTTLLRQLKTVLAPHGDLAGEILFEGKPLKSISQREQSSRIGFVMQNPDNQIVTDKVWHELAFGLESLGYDSSTIRGRVAEMSSFFGIESWFYKNITELSGGQKQLLNLASIMAMQPSVLILDEPTSQLDPIAAADFLATVGKINRELGTTIIITEHRLEEVFPMTDRVLVMDEGRLICSGSPREVGDELKNSRHGMFLAMPAPMRIHAAVPNNQMCPITVRDGRIWLDEFSKGHPLSPIADPADNGRHTSHNESAESPIIELDNLWFKYEKEQPDVLRGLSAKIYKGEFVAILGGNGTGKTTSMSLISGINRPYRGKVFIQGKQPSEHKNLFNGLLGVLPQDPQSLFVKKTVREDLFEILKTSKITKAEKEKKISSVSRLCGLNELLDRHPYDLSGGEQQRAALAKVLLLEPQILLLDEPTKGLDAEFKLVFAEILKRLLEQQVTIVMVSHDIEFCAKYAHRCALFFDGNIVTDGSPRFFFSGNSFYTTSANRMARHLLPEAITAEDIIESCGVDLPPFPGSPDQQEETDFDEQYSAAVIGDQKNIPDSAGPSDSSRQNEKKPLPLWRKATASIAGFVALLTVFIALKKTEMAAIEPFSPVSAWLTGESSFGIYIVLIAALIILGISVSRKNEAAIENEQISLHKRKLPKRTIAATVIILVTIPLTIFVGSYYFDNRKYYFFALLLILQAMVPFFLIFEGRKPQARELIILSVLCAIGVAGRAAFFMLPQFKPVAAIIIISGVAFGGEAGFLIGAVTMMVSNIMFGQGPWTPMQMFAMGIIGFLAGVLFKKGFLRRNRLSLSIFGGLSTILIFGGLMNPTYILIFNESPTWQMLLSAYIVGFPMDLVHAFATAFFIWIFSRPMLEKLDRLKVKYGLVSLESAQMTDTSDSTSEWEPGHSAS